MADLDLDELERLCIPLDGLLALLREAWRDDGAEGESVHRLCDIVEKVPALIAEARYAAKARVVVETRGGMPARYRRLHRPRRQPDWRRG